MKKLFCVLLWIYTILLMGCSSPKRYMPPQHTVDTIEELSKQLITDVYLDCTLSMQGFVTPGITTEYARVLDRLEGSITTGWENVSLNYYRFGTYIKRISGGEQKKAVTPSFYNDADIFSKTSIEKVVDTADTSHLIIIVTDLFQNDADVSTLVSKIKNKFLKRNFSIGLVAVKSDFHGTVFDVGINRDRFPYTGKRPFYLIVFGKHRDIEHFYNSLSIRILNEIREHYFLLLSRHFSYPLLSFNGASVLQKVNIDEISNILPHNTNDPRVKQL